MTQDQLHQKLEHIENKTGNFSGMQVLTILVIVGGIILGYCDRNQTTAVDNTKVLSVIGTNAQIATQQFNSIKDSLSLFKIQINDKMDLNHQNTQYKIDQLNSRINVIDQRVKHLEIGAVTEKRTSRGIALIPYKP